MVLSASEEDLKRFPDSPSSRAAAECEKLKKNAELGMCPHSASHLSFGPARAALPG
jgi:hypothetical protein